MARRIEQASGDLLAANYGTLYPARLKLAQDGYISSERASPITTAKAVSIVIWNKNWLLISTCTSPTTCAQGCLPPKDVVKPSYDSVALNQPRKTTAIFAIFLSSRKSCIFHQTFPRLPSSLPVGCQQVLLWGPHISVYSSVVITQEY